MKTNIFNPFVYIYRHSVILNPVGDDGMSWNNGYPIPGRTNYPLLWDRQKQPELALNSVLHVPYEK
jgi:hypothetical protein